MIGTQLWHASEQELPAGALIAPGRFGKLLSDKGGRDDPCFFREQLLEFWRVTKTNVTTSRLNCAFAFEDEADAKRYARENGRNDHLYVVEPADSIETGVRLDMLWITWLGEPRSTFEATVTRCRLYWDGQSTRDLKVDAQPDWEWLFAHGLRVIQLVF